MSHGRLVLAHRGDHRRLVENTIPALVAGCALSGIDGVEFDVRTSADGEPFVIHDETLARTFGADAAVATTPAADLARLGVPNMADVLAAIPADAFLDIELKVPPTTDFLAAVRSGRGPELHRAVVSSFDDAALAGVGRAAPRWPLWLNVVTLDSAAVRRAVGLGCRGIAAEQRSVTAGSFALARRAGLEVAAWTVRRRPSRARLARLGVEVLIVEGPALAVDLGVAQAETSRGHGVHRPLTNR
jgi:glycerophosphoryl diester phosphodiesterase